MNSKQIPGPLNLGNENEISILETAKFIIQKVGSTSKIKHLDLPSDDPKQRKPDTRAAFETLNWQASTSFEDGIKQTINNFKDRF